MTFFDDPKEQSLVKASIVSKYFWAWAKVITSVQNRHPSAERRIAYVDLFAGPGRYEDNTKSTPLLVLEKVISEPWLAARLVTVFNDRDLANTQSLERAIRGLPGIDRLQYQPVVQNIEIGSAIAEQFWHLALVPTLLFVDPWGYKGLSLTLIDSFLRNWGCDCVFFFNYNRINMGLNNEVVTEHMNALFGAERANELRDKLLPLSPHERELMIVEELGQAFRTQGYTYVLPFRFRNDKGTRTSHHLIFISKAFLGYDIMKGIMANASSGSAQGVATFEYNPADKCTPLLFELSTPIDDLADMLLTEYAGETLTLGDLYEHHSVNRPYTERNYKDVLLHLEADMHIRTSPGPAERRKGTFSSTVEISFPPYKGRSSRRESSVRDKRGKLAN